jgi:hypothetical protein
MSRKFTARGRYTVLPIVGNTLVEVRLGTCRLPALIFRAADGSEAELTIEEAVTLTRGKQVQLLEGSKPGETFSPRELAPLLDLLGSEVTDALAEKEGQLRIEFTGNLLMTVTPSHGYEAWHFQYPPPGAGAGAKHVGLTGADGRLI